MINAKDKFYRTILGFIAKEKAVFDCPLDEADDKYKNISHVCGYNNECIKESANVSTNFHLVKFENGLFLINGNVSFIDSTSKKHSALVFFLYSESSNVPIAKFISESKMNDDGLSVESCAVVVNNEYGIFYEDGFHKTSFHKTFERVAYIDEISSKYCIFDLLACKGLKPYNIFYQDGAPFITNGDNNMSVSQIMDEVN